MNGGGEAIGDLATGTAWARVAEPTAGEAEREAHSGPCLNCGTALTGRYCHACGQSSHVHKTLMSIVHDLLHGVFHFEGKIWRTVPMLVLHPGQLTRRYIDGERAKFVSPLALFLFTVFLMFTVFSLVGAGDLTAGFADGGAEAKLEQQRVADAGELAALERRRAALVADDRPTATIDRQIAKGRSDLAALTQIAVKLKAAPGAMRVRSDIGWLDHALEKARQNPGLVVYKVQSAAYKFSWAVIFLSTPLVALLFLWRRQFGLYDHATFVTYSICFMSLLTILLELLLTINGPGWLFTLLLLAVPAHMFVQLRGTYALSTFSALWRTIVLLFGSTFILMLFVFGVIVLEVAH